MPDLMDAMQEQQLKDNDALHERARSKVMASVAPPDARDCGRCDEPIAKARLNAMPSATFCVECEEALEKIQRRFAPR